MNTEASSPGGIRPSFLKLAFSNDLPARALSVAIIVGTVLTLINQGDALFFGETPDFLKMALTYFVPYCVVTYGAVSAMQKAAAEAEAHWPSDSVLTVPTLIEAALPAPTPSAPDSLAPSRHQLTAVVADAATLRDDARMVTSLLAAAERHAMASTGAVANRGSEVADTILGLARQMHLTALNASLEAVRAGVGGEGFGAIAGDLNRLARQIMTGAEDLRREMHLGEGMVPSNAMFGDALAAAERHLDRISALTARIERMERDLPATASS